MLMSGTDNHLYVVERIPTTAAAGAGADLASVGLGQMAETIGRDPFYQGRPGYEGMLNDVSVCCGGGNPGTDGKVLLRTSASCSASGNPE
jgi:hypothetical protein